MGVQLKLTLLLVLATFAGAQDKPAVDPITDKARFELALAQRDYLSAKLQLDAALAALKAKIAENEKACASTGQVFDVASFHCKEK